MGHLGSADLQHQLHDGVIMADLSHLSPLEKLGNRYGTLDLNAKIAETNERTLSLNPEAETVEPWTEDFYYITKSKEANFALATKHQRQMATDAISKVMTLDPAIQSQVFAALGLNIPGLMAAGVTAQEIPEYALNKYLALSREQKDVLVALVYPELA